MYRTYCKCKKKLMHKACKEQQRGINQFCTLQSLLHENLLQWTKLMYNIVQHFEYASNL